MKKLSLVCLAVLVSAAPAFAEGYGDAGCGLGSMIFSSNTISSQTVAATTNYAFLAPLSITTGTSNCSRKGFVMDERKSEFFAEANFETLMVEMAKGEGKVLAAFAQTLGCQDGQTVTFSQMTQQKYDQIFTSEKTTSYEMLENVVYQIEAHPVLARACGSV